VKFELRKAVDCTTAKRARRRLYADLAARLGGKKAVATSNYKLARRNRKLPTTQTERFRKHQFGRSVPTAVIARSSNHAKMLTGGVKCRADQVAAQKRRLSLD